MRPAPSGTASGPFPFPGPATFVTADNPRGRTASEAENARGRTTLAAFLDGSGLVWHPAVGGDPEGDHHEPGAVVLGLDLTASVEIGARFHQAAIYVWTCDALHLVACADDRHDVLGFRSTAGTSLTRPT